MSRRLQQDDSLVPKVIKEISKELNLREDLVKHAIQHFFQWQRNAFNNLKYSKFLWNYFGTFSILPKRYDKYILSDKYIKQQKTLLETEKQKLLTNKNKSNE